MSSQLNDNWTIIYFIVLKVVSHIGETYFLL